VLLTPEASALRLVTAFAFDFFVTQKSFYQSVYRYFYIFLMIYKNFMPEICNNSDRDTWARFLDKETEPCVVGTDVSVDALQMLEGEGLAEATWQFFGMANGAVTPFLIPGTPAMERLSAVVQLRWSTDRAEKFNVAISLSPFESFVLPLSQLHPLVHAYATSIYPRLPLITLAHEEPLLPPVQRFV
jgi:hypothetical protein